MTHEGQSQHQAAGRIGIAISRLAGHYPFHAAILERFVLEHEAEISTMGVTVRRYGVALLFNATFVLNLPIGQLVGVLLHEVHHVLFNHLLSDPKEYPDEWARTVAEEVTVNEFICEPLPAGAITLEQFPALKPMQSTDERYNRLKGRIRRPPIAVDAAGTLPAPGAGERRSKQKPSGGQLRTVDDHRTWQESRQDPKCSKSAVEQIVRAAVQQVGSENVPDYLTKAAGLPCSARGETPGGREIDLGGHRSAQLDWRSLLRRYVGQLRQPRPVFNRPSRRFPKMVGIIPGRRRQPPPPRVLAAIDTSGSITPGLLELINAELGKLAKDYEVTVVECDAAIQQAYRYKPLRTVLGGGGTDLRPPLEPEFLQHHKPDLVVYFTDGAGPAPTSPPRIPLVWCLVPGGKAPCKWGWVVKMEALNTKK